MSDRKTFFGVQVLRGLAAFLVLAFHTAAELRDGAAPDMGGRLKVFATLPVPYFGNGGVDLFFLISGFVIVWTTKDVVGRPNAWSMFLQKRLIRIVPLYWLLTSVKLVAALALPALFRGSAIEPWNAVASYLLIPSTNPEGIVQPIISAGWTLCYEMLFYYIFAACLAARIRPVPAATPVLIAAACVGVFRQPSWGGAATLLDPLLLEFVAGMWIAELAQRGRVVGGKLTLTGLFALGAVALVASDLLAPQLAYQYRVLVWGLPAFAILYATIGLEPLVDFRRMRMSLLLGNSWSSLYLSHVLALPLLILAARRFGLLAAGPWVVFATVLAAAVLVGVAIWYIVEQRLLRVLVDVLRGEKPRQPALRPRPSTR